LPWLTRLAVGEAVGALEFPAGTAAQSRRARLVGRRLACVPPGRGRSRRSRYSRPSRGKSPPTVAAETPAGWLPPRPTSEVVVVADRVVVGSMLVVVVVGSVLVVVGPVVVDSTLVVVSRVVVDSTLEVETAVVVGAVMVGSGAVLGVVTEGWIVAPRAEGVLVAVVSLGSGASAGVCRPAVVIGRLTAEGVLSGLLVGGEGAVVGSCVVMVVVVVVKDVDVEVRAGSVVTVGSATPGARCGDGDCGGNKVAEATRAARTAVVSPKATSRSLQGRRGLARCRGGGVGMCIVPVRLFLPDQGCPRRRRRYRAHRS
jgi:hypothetical protein